MKGKNKPSHSYMIFLFPADSDKSPSTELEELDEEDLLRKAIAKAIAMSLEEKEVPHYLTGVLKMMNSSHHDHSYHLTTWSTMTSHTWIKGTAEPVWTTWTTPAIMNNSTTLTT